MEKGICEQQDGFLYDKTGQMYVPNTEGLCVHIITLHHSSPVTGHLGDQKTQELIEHQYYWSRLSSDICSYSIYLTMTSVLT